MMLKHRLWACFTLVAFFLGCYGPGASIAYYTLRPVQQIPNLSEGQGTDRLIIGIGPVALPDYLDRRAIVTCITPNRLEVNEGHRWAGSLQSEITRVLAANLESRLPAREVVLFPWNTMIEPDLRFRVEIQAFEGGLGNEVTLKAAWSLAPAQSQQPAMRRVSLIQEKADGEDIEDLVAAMAKALGGLSEEMAGAVEKAAQ